MKHAITAIALAGLWLLMSGLFKPLILAFGAGSVLFVVFVMARMDRVDEDTLCWKLRPLAFLGYIAWLMWEIAKANWTVTKVILSPRLSLRQHLFVVPVTAETDVAQVSFANSITLTPGTITVETEPRNFLVHALSFSESDPGAIAEMDRRVTACEKKGGD